MGVDLMAKMGRPRKEINRKEFEGLLALQCTLEEITSFFDHKLGGCCEDTIENWCKREYGETFSEVSAKKRNLGKISLRRIQLRLAEKSPAMAIFLGKQVLGQKDQVEMAVKNTDESVKEMEEYFNSRKNE